MNARLEVGNAFRKIFEEDQENTNIAAIITDSSLTDLIEEIEENKRKANLTEEERNDLESKRAKLFKTIKDLEDFEPEQYKKWLKERRFNPLTKEQKDFKNLVESANLKYESVIPALSMNYVSKATNQVVLKVKRSTAYLNPPGFSDINNIRVAILSVKDKINKPYLSEPSPCSQQEALEFYRNSVKVLLTECNGKFEFKDITIANKAYRDIIANEFAGYRVNATIGEGGVEYDEKHDGVKNSKLPEKSPEEKLAFDAAYELLKATEIAKNRIVNVNRDFQLVDSNKKRKNAVNAINASLTGEDFKGSKFLNDSSVKSSFDNLLKTIDKFEKTLDKFETVPENLKEVKKAIDLLKETGFNPSSKNKDFSILNLSSESKKTLKNMTQGLEIVESLILRNTEMEVARLNKNDSKSVKRLSDLHKELESAVREKDFSKISEFSATHKGSELNKVLSNNNGSKIFPDDKNVIKLSLAGEAVDLYFFVDDKGTVREVKGSGNRYDKSIVSEFKASEIKAFYNDFLNRENSPAPAAPAVDTKPDLEPVKAIDSVDGIETVKAEAPEIKNELKAAEPVETPKTAGNDISGFEKETSIEVPDNKEHETNLKNALEDLDFIDSGKIVSLVRLCPCCGNLNCFQLEENQRQFNQFVKSYLEENKPNESNMFIETPNYLAVKNKVEDLKTEYNASISPETVKPAVEPVVEEENKAKRKPLFKQ